MSPEQLCSYIQGRGNGTNLAEQFDYEKESLLSRGKENDILYSAETFSQRKAGEEQYLGGGNEHDATMMTSSLEWFLLQGYQEGDRPHTFIQTSTPIIHVFDARPDNVIFTKNNKVVPIDLQIIVQ